MSSAQEISCLPSGVSRVTVKAWTFMPRTLATGALRRTATLRPVKAERATVEVERVKADIFVMCVSVTCCDLRGRPTIGVYSQIRSRFPNAVMAEQVANEQ